MHDFDSQIISAEHSLADALKHKIHELNMALRNKDRLILKIDDELRGVKDKFHHNLEVIKERDLEINQLHETVQKLSNDIENSNAINSQSLEQYKEEKIALEDKLGLRTLEIKDLREKNASQKNELKFYKKGYLDEIAVYKNKIQEQQDTFEKEKQLLKDHFQKEIEKAKVDYSTHIEELSLTQKEKMDTIKDGLSTELNELKAETLKKSSRIRELEKENFTFANDLENARITIQNLEKKVSLFSEELSATSNDEFKKMMSLKMELQKELAIKEHILADTKLKLEKEQRKHKSSKSKYNEILQNMQKEYEEKILEMVVEYRKEISEKEQISQKTQQQNSHLKSELQKLTEQMKDNEKQLKIAGEDLEENIEFRQIEYAEKTKKLMNELEIALERMHSAEEKAEKASSKNKEILDKFAATRIQLLDLEKENQILIDQVLSLKQSKKGNQLNIASNDREERELNMIEEVDSNAAESRQESNLELIKLGSSERLFSEDMGDPSNLFKGSDLLRSRNFVESTVKKIVEERLKSSRNNHLEEENIGLKELIEEMRREMERAKEEMQQTVEKVKYFKDENSELLEKYKLIVDKELRAREEIMQLKEQIGMIKNKGLMEKEEINQLEGDISELKRNVSTLKNEKAILEEKIVELTRQKNDQISSLEEDRDQLLSNLSKTRAKMIKYKDACENVFEQENIDVVLAEIDKLRIEKDQLNQTLFKKEDENKRLRTNLEKYIYAKPKKSKSNVLSSNQPEQSNPNKQKVRNFNLRDDKEFRRTLEGDD